MKELTYESQGQHLESVANKLHIDLSRVGIFISQISQGARGEHYIAGLEDDLKHDQEMFMRGLLSCKLSKMDKTVLNKFVEAALEVRKTLHHVGVPSFEEEFVQEVENELHE